MRARATASKEAAIRLIRLQRIQQLQQVTWQLRPEFRAAICRHLYKAARRAFFRSFPVAGWHQTSRRRQPAGAARPGAQLRPAGCRAPGATLVKTGERRHGSAGGDRPCHDGSVLAYPEQQ